ncbi:MAG: DUF1992 domain-containing protein [Paracoccus sp. (in: a-proteobacteria)]|nr:DUF1992 domain-containing protein [Paracoccus sp. (in: a-proteobacteria)]
MSWVDLIAERRMREAERRGDLSGLEGEGRPLDPVRLRESSQDVLMRMMADAGAVPAEFVLGRQIDEARARLADMPEGAARAAQQKLINDLTLRRDIARDARRRFMRG